MDGMKEAVAASVTRGIYTAVFQTPEKQNEQSPDATIHLFEGD
jgi:hypothetical protein